MYEVFVSFDYENDRRYKFLLEAWNENPQFQFTFADRSSREVQSNDVGRVKAAITQKIRSATSTLVIVGEYANQPHKDRMLIGYRNWINFEIAQSKACGNQLVAVKLNRTFESPDELRNANARWAMSFSQDAILKAIRGW
jgi:hypothetical protein